MACWRTERKNMKTLQISLAAARVNAGLTQAEVAEALHVSKRTIVNWEKGKVVPPFSSIQVLADMYGIPVDYIFCLKK